MFSNNQRKQKIPDRTKKIKINVFIINSTNKNTYNVNFIKILDTYINCVVLPIWRDRVYQ